MGEYSRQKQAPSIVDEMNVGPEGQLTKLERVNDVFQFLKRTKRDNAQTAMDFSMVCILVNVSLGCLVKKRARPPPTTNHAMGNLITRLSQERQRKSLCAINKRFWAHGRREAHAALANPSLGTRWWTIWKSAGGVGLSSGQSLFGDKVVDRMEANPSLGTRWWTIWKPAGGVGLSSGQSLFGDKVVDRMEACW